MQMSDNIQDKILKLVLLGWGGCECELGGIG